jgi:hypothetical protein
LEAQKATTAAAAAAAAAAATAATAAAAAPKASRAPNRKRPMEEAFGGEREGEEGVAAQEKKKALKNLPKTVQGRHTTQLRNHLKRQCKFIRYFQTIVIADHITACKFVPSAAEGQ